MSDCGCCGRPAGNAYACTTCERSAQAHLANIASFTRHLDSKRALERSNWTTGTIGRVSSQPLPYDPRVTQVTAPILRTLRSIAGPHAGDGTLREVALYLSHRTNLIRHHPSGPASFQAIEKAQAALVALFDNPGSRLYMGRCNHSNTEGAHCPQSLYIDATDDMKPASAFTTCPACQHVHQVSERQEELKAGVADYLGTTNEISNLCRHMLGDDVSPAMIRGYHHRGILASKGTRLVDTKAGHRQADLYQLGDVFTAAANTKEREATRKAIATEARRLTRLHALGHPA